MDQPTANWDHCLEHAALSDVGLRRANNQDALAVVIAGSQEMWQRRGHLFTVADGMGAHAAGELASKLAADTVPLTYTKLLHLSPPEAILAAVQDANLQIHNRGQADPEFQGMGTTSTSLLLLPAGAVVAHVGDSRAYRLHGNRFEQLTFDHSLVWEMRAAERIAEDEVPDYIPKNIITRSLGPNPTVQADLEGPFPIAVGDTFLLCSDGLSGQVPDEEIGVILGAMPPSEAVRALVDLANLRGGPDNVTVIVARVTGPQIAGGSDSGTVSSPGASKAAPVHPLVWTLLGAAVLAAAGGAAMRYWATALVFLIGALAAAVVALVQRFGSEEPEFRFNGRPLGKGPHKACEAVADAQFVERLDGIVRELRDAATRERWNVHWEPFDAYLDQAAGAADDHARAVREYCHAISFMMGQLKDQHRCGGDGVPGP